MPCCADEPLAGYTTLKVGGPAAALVRAETAERPRRRSREVCAELDVPWLILGRGSNLLVADEGWPGVVVTLGRGFRGADRRADAEPASIGDAVEVVAGAAEPMPVLANTVAGWGLGGLAFGVAIPGSLGGAVRMNAGAHGGQMRDVLRRRRGRPPGDGARARRSPADALDMTYRHTDAAARRCRRAAHACDCTGPTRSRWPPTWPRCASGGASTSPSTSRRAAACSAIPQGDSAGRLIEAAGMKGHRVGGAQVSAVHANFITVAPGSRAADVRAVILAVIAAVVDATHGVHAADRGRAWPDSPTEQQRRGAA